MFQVGCFKHFRWICHTNVNLGFKAVFKQNCPFFLSCLCSLQLHCYSFIPLIHMHVFYLALLTFLFSLQALFYLLHTFTTDHNVICKHYSPQILLAYLIYQNVHHNYKQEGSQSRSLI